MDVPDYPQQGDLADALVVFGITGDLAYKKIFPALENLERRGRLPPLVIGVARGGTALDSVIGRMHASLAEHGGSVDDEAVARLAAKLHVVAIPRSGDVPGTTCGAATPAGPVITSQYHPASLHL
jgi:glucose-6-phosphate 1-dehydrogenase